MEMVSGDNWSYKTYKAPAKLSPPTNQINTHTFFTGLTAFLSPRSIPYKTETEDSVQDHDICIETRRELMRRTICRSRRSSAGRHCGRRSTSARRMPCLRNPLPLRSFPSPSRASSRLLPASAPQLLTHIGTTVLSVLHEFNFYYTAR